MKKRISNKGAAMVTVLIAIMFIGILATSLLYMAYMNYLTKSMKYSATDNFYTDEFALDDLASTIQQTAATKSTIDEAKAAVKSSCGAAGSPLRYNNADVQNLIQVASKESNITVNTNVPAGTPNYIEGSSSIKLVGVEITSTTDAGYTSTIVTDIVLKFPNSGTGDMDINDFSMISDSILALDNNSGDLVLGGYIYIRQSAGTSYALEAANGRIITLLSKRGIIDGNVRVANNSVLAITGDITIKGNVKLENNAVLICTGKLSVSGTVSKDGTSHISGDANIKQHFPIADDALPADGLVTNLYARNIYIQGGSATEYLDLRQYAIDHGKSTAFETFGLIQNDGHYDINNFENVCNTNRDNHLYNVKMGLDIGATNGFDSALVMTWRDIDIRGDYPDSTLMTTGKFHYDLGHQTTMTKLEKDGYDAVKRTYVKFHNQFSEFNTSAYPHTDQNISWAVGSFNDMKNVMKQIRDGSKAGFIGVYDQDGNYTVYGDGSHGCPKLPYTDAEIDAFTVDDTQRYAVSTLSNYTSTGITVHLPAGYMIRPDSGSYISGIFNGIQGEQDPTNTNILYDNWEKQ